MPQVAGTAHALPSGALHDAAEMARRVPTVMLFVTSIGGVSHSPVEDTPVEHLELMVRDYARLTARTLEWVAGGAPRLCWPEWSSVIEMRAGHAHGWGSA